MTTLTKQFKRRRLQLHRKFIFLIILLRQLFLFSNWLQLNLLLLHQLSLNSFYSTITPTQSTPSSSTTTQLVLLNYYSNSIYSFFINCYSSSVNCSSSSCSYTSSSSYCTSSSSSISHNGSKIDLCSIKTSNSS